MSNEKKKNDIFWTDFNLTKRLTGLIWARFGEYWADFDEFFNFLDTLRLVWKQTDFSTPIGQLFWQVFDEQDYEIVLRILFELKNNYDDNGERIE